MGKSGERGIYGKNGLGITRMIGKMGEGKSGAGQEEVLGGRGVRRKSWYLFILSYPPGSSPTIWTLYLVSREEVKQSTEARSTWEKEHIKAWEEMGALEEAKRAQHERIIMQDWVVAGA